MVLTQLNMWCVSLLDNNYDSMARLAAFRLIIIGCLAMSLSLMPLSLSWQWLWSGIPCIVKLIHWTHMVLLWQPGGVRVRQPLLRCIFDSPGFEINARPLARGDWKPRGMSRIFAQVVRRASEYFNLFCQLCVTMNETNYWNLTRKSIKIITNCQNNLVLATVARTAKSCSVGHGYKLKYTSAHPRRISDKHQVTFLPCDFNLFDLNLLRYHEPVVSYQIWWTVPHCFGNDTWTFQVLWAMQHRQLQCRRARDTVSATCLIKLSCPRSYCSCP